MNSPLIKQMLEHRSIRSFDPNKAVPLDILENILKAVQQAPNSCHAQQVSAVVIQDKESRQKIMEFAKGRGGYQQHIVDAPVFVLFVADYYKVNLVMQEAGNTFELMETIESIMTSSVDAGIALGTFTAAAESYGLGTVCIGALRWHDLEPLIKFLDLPQKTFPISGICLGYPSAEGAQTKVKPRLPYDTFVHQEKYHKEAFENYSQVLEQFNQKMSSFTGASTWTAGIGTVYSNPILGRHLTKNFKDQGFRFNDTL